jgi:cytochrome c oxidase assembly protein subunit 15
MRWQDGQKPRVSPVASIVRRLAVVTCVLVYLQIVLGAVVRHAPIDRSPTAFMGAVHAHLTMAAVVTVDAMVLAWLVHRHVRSVKPLSRLALTLVGLIAIQLLLGVATWIVRFSVPVWASDWWPGGVPSVQAGGWLQTHVITAHVAGGSLLLATSIALALAAARNLSAPAAMSHANRARLGVAT